MKPKRKVSNERSQSNINNSNSLFYGIFYIKNLKIQKIQIKKHLSPYYPKKVVFNITIIMIKKEAQQISDQTPFSSLMTNH